MGNQSPKGGAASKFREELEEDVYILEDIQEVTLQPKNRQLYYWIDPKIFNSENQKYETYLKKYLELDTFSSVEGLNNTVSDLEPNQKFKVICAASLDDEDYKSLQSDPRIPAMFLFCQNQERAKLLRANFPKIKAAKFDIKEVVEAIQEIQASEVTDPKINMLFMVEEDTNLMNKHRINFFSLTCKHSAKVAKKDFITFAEKIYPESIKDIEQFEKNYKVGLPAQERTKQALEWIEKDNFFLESTQRLPKITTNPKKLGYLRFSFKEIHDAIMHHYRSRPKKKQQIFMVMTPTPEEIERLSSNTDNYFIFTYFAKAFTKEKAAHKVFKANPKSIMLRVIIPTLTGKSVQNLDFGYWVNPDKETGANVVFNIYNVFKILEYVPGSREGIIEYGVLADVAFKRDKRRDEYRLTPLEERLIHNYDYLEDTINNITSQATVLQMSGYYKQSIQVFDKKFQFIRKSQPSQEILDKHTIEMGDVYAMNEDFDQALEQYDSIKGGKMYWISLVHKAELFLKMDKKPKFEKVIQEIEANLGKYQEISHADAFKARNFIGLELINRAKYKEANDLFKKLLNDAALFYDYKYEGIPLVHDIYRNRATCLTKLNFYDEALGILNSTKNWQRICEGSKSPGLIVTENLIKSVHLSRGNSSELMESEREIQRMQSQMNPTDNLYLSRSNIMVNLDQSSFQVMTSEPKVQNIEQSAFFVDTSAPKKKQNQNVNESDFHIDL